MCDDEGPCKWRDRAKYVSKDGDWFLNTNRFNCELGLYIILPWKLIFPACLNDLGSNVQAALDFLQVPVNSVEFFTFVPDPTGYVCKARLIDGTFNLVRSNVPESLETHLATLTKSDVQVIASVSVGASGGWVVTHQSGRYTWMDIPDRLAGQIKDGIKQGEKV